MSRRAWMCVANFVLWGTGGLLVGVLSLSCAPLRPPAAHEENTFAIGRLWLVRAHHTLDQDGLHTLSSEYNWAVLVVLTGVSGLFGVQRGLVKSRPDPGSVRAEPHPQQRWSARDLASIGRACANVCRRMPARVMTFVSTKARTLRRAQRETKAIQLQLGMIFAMCVVLLAFDVPLGNLRPLERHTASALALEQGLPTIAGTDQRGEPTSWRPTPGNPALLLVLSPFCPSCEDALPRWKELIDFIHPLNSEALPIAVVIVSLGPRDLTAEFLATKDLGGQLIHVNTYRPGSPAEALCGEWLDGPPRTILIDGGGRVRRSGRAVHESEVSTWTEEMLKTLVPK